MIDFSKKLREMDEPPQPFSHPPIREGRKRIIITGVEHTTEKARLIILKNERKVWVPKSVSELRNGNEKRGVTEEDKNTVIDIDQDFYEQTIA